ncbi:MAG: phosphate signaling complex protein PhoU [Acidimicrobiales bacterium]
MNEIRTQLDERLDHIESRLKAMIDVVGLRTEAVTNALLEADINRADDIIVGDDEVDLQSLEVEDLCIATLLREQPVATDLRFIVAAMHMNSDIERSADLTTNIAKAVGRLQGAQPDERVRELILLMSQQAQQLFHRAGEALQARDAQLAATIDELDDVLDDLHVQYIQTVIQNARQGDLVPQQSLQLALIGRFYERIGDHAENIGEHIIYVVDGTRPGEEAAVRAQARRDRVAVDGSIPVPSRGLAVIESEAEDRRIDAIRRDFVANVSHELKTPIGAIVLLAETIADADNDDDRARLVAHLRRETSRVELIIDDLLELTRLEELGRPEHTDVTVDDVVGQATDTVRGLAEGLGIEIALVGIPSHETVPGDAGQLVRALVNLIDNAVRYSESGNQVIIEAGRVGDHVEISVKDHGVGIPRADLERVFERFYRVDRARSRETGGTGLGLAIVRHVADNHGGRIFVDSKPAEGSTFTLQLPLSASSDG